MDYIINNDKDLSKYLHECEYLALSDFVFAHSDGVCGLREEEDGLMTPNSTLDNTFLHTSSGSSESEEMEYRMFGCTATTEFVKKKRSAIGVCEAAMNAESLNRRKSTPHRSPFY